MRYMLMFYGSEDAWSQQSPDARERIGQTHRKIQRELRDSGELVDHRELPLAGAAVVRVAAGRTEIADGPFSEGSELLSGFYVVDVADADRAIEIAARFEEAQFAPIEVRTMSSSSSWDT